MRYLARLGQNRSRLSRLASVGSQFLNVLIFNGHPSESISGKAYRLGVIEGWPWQYKAMKLIDLLFFWENQHCKRAHLLDVAMALYFKERNYL